MNAKTHPRLAGRFGIVGVMLAASIVAAQQPPTTDWKSEGPFLASPTDVAFDPSRPDTIYLATTNGGVYRSDDGGRTWILPGDELTSREIRWVEVDRANANTVWAGEHDPGNPSLWRSNDRGATWELVTDSYRGEMRSLHPVGWRLAFAPSKPSDIWVPSTNLNYRTRDGGKTWSDFRVPGQDVYAIAVHPSNPDIVWAGGIGDKHYVSRTDDGGRTWKPVGKGIDRRVTAIVTDGSPQPTLYAIAGSNNLLRSTDNADTFTAMPSPASGTDDVLRLVVTPGAAKHLWAVTEAGLFKSTDGRQWAQSDRGTGRYLVTAISFHPNDPRTVIAAAAGAGVYRSTTGGDTWATSNSGIAAGFVEQLYARAGSPALFVKTGAGTFRRDANGLWIELQTPFVSRDEEVELDGFMIEGASGAVWAFRGADAWRSIDNGRTFGALDYRRSLTSVDRVGFRSLAQHPQNPKVLWAGNWTAHSPGTSVYKTTDGGREWRPSGKGLPEEAVTMLQTGAPDEVFALVGRRTLFATRDGGNSWTRIGRGLPDADVSHIAVDSTDAARLFLVSDGGLFRSTDRGASFARVGGTLEKERVRAIAVAADGAAFAGAFNGVFVSRDAGATFTAMEGKLPNTDVRAIAIGGSGEMRLWIGVAGGSVWSRPLPRK